MRLHRSLLVLGLAATAATLGFTSPARAAGTPHADSTAGWLLVARDEPVELAHVRAISLRGQDLTVEDGLSGTYGVFNLWTKRLPARYILESTGGTVNGLPLNGHLRALVVDYGPDRPVYLNPATTLAAQYALDHPKLPYAEVVRRVKLKLGLLPTTTLGESLRRSGLQFDGAAFLAQAAREGGLDTFVRKLAADIDSHPARKRAFPTTRHLDQDPLTSIGTSVGGGLAKAGLGFLLSKVGLASVNDALGLNSNVQLDAINSQLTQISATLDVVTQQLDTLHQGVAGVLTAVAGSDYANLNSDLLTALSFQPHQAGVGVLALGGPNDTILNDSAFVAQSAAEAANILARYLPAAATNDPLDWCAANEDTQAPPNPYDGNALYKDMCAKLEHDLGTGGPPAGTDQVAWCAARPIVQTNLAMPDWSCAILALAAAYPSGSTSGDWSETAYNAVVGSNGGDGLLAAYGKMRYTQVVTWIGTAGQPFLTATSYSQYVDDLASVWESRVALLGQYTSIYDTAKPPLPADCSVAGITNLEPVAECDVELATDRAVNGIPAAAPPDIPDAMMVDTRTKNMWFMVQPKCPTQSTPYLFSFSDPGCGLGGGNFEIAPSIGDLKTLVSGWNNWEGFSGTETASPNLWLTEGGAFPDFSSLASVQQPVGYGPTGWAGNEFSVTTWDKFCTFNALILDEYDQGSADDNDPYNIEGMLCPTIRLTDGVEIDECVQNGGDAGFSSCDTPFDLTSDQQTLCTARLSVPADSQCHMPTTYDWTQPPYNQHLDYFHPDLVFSYFSLSGTPYWVSPD